jgi:hypothetical protein
MRAKSFYLIASMTLMLATCATRADLAFMLTPTTQSGAETSEVIFTGTLSNTSPSNCLFLNDLEINFFEDATNYLSADTNEFFANVPGILLPGETYSGEIFGVYLGLAVMPGDYFGNIVLLGGTNIFATANMPVQTFHLSWPDSVGDGIPDWWRTEYFGGDGTTTNDQSCATCDADNTGQNNRFKYVAGLDPTNAASVFTLGISLPSQPSLTFGPALPGRIYTVQYSSNLTSKLWDPLTAASTSNTTNQLTLTDTNAMSSQCYYRIQISLP